MKTDPEAGSVVAFELISVAARYSDLMSAIAGCCDRLVGPAVAQADRSRVTRLAGSLIGFSFIVASALALVLPRIAGAPPVCSLPSARFWRQAPWLR